MSAERRVGIVLVGLAVLVFTAGTTLAYDYTYVDVRDHTLGNVIKESSNRLMQSATPTSGSILFELNSAFVYTYNLATSTFTNYGQVETNIGADLTGITGSGKISGAGYTGDMHDSYSWNGSAWQKTGDNAFQLSDASETYMAGYYGHGYQGFVWDYADPAKTGWFTRPAGMGQIIKSCINDANDLIITDFSSGSYLYTGGSMNWDGSQWNWNGGSGWSSALNFGAESINNSGQIAGQMPSTAGADAYKAMVYDRNTTNTTVIPFLALDLEGNAIDRANVNAISDNGVVTGVMYNHSYWRARQGFVWDSVKGLRSLCDASVVSGLPSGDAGILYEGEDVNDYGLIVGRNYVGDLFLLVPTGTPPPTHNPGDVNDDDFVGGADLTQILTNWGMSGATWADGDVSPYATFGDGFVGGADYTEVLTYWGTSYAPQAIPEPATIGLLLIGGLAGLLRRR